MAFRRERRARPLSYDGCARPPADTLRFRFPPPPSPARKRNCLGRDLARYTQTPIVYRFAATLREIDEPSLIRRVAGRGNLYQLDGPRDLSVGLNWVKRRGRRRGATKQTKEHHVATGLLSGGNVHC